MSDDFVRAQIRTSLQRNSMLRSTPDDASAWGAVMARGDRLRAHAIKRRRLAFGVLMLMGLLGVVAIATVDSREHSIATHSRDTAETHVEPIPDPVDDDRCLRLDVGQQSHRACIRLPGVSLWRVEGVDLLVARGAMELSDGALVEADASGFVVVPFAEYRDRLRGLWSCADNALLDAVERELGPQPPPILVTGCGPSYAWVTPQYYRSADTNKVLLFEWQTPEWVRIATVDFSQRDRQTRCSVIPKRPPPAGGISAYDTCLILGG